MSAFDISLSIVLVVAVTKIVEISIAVHVGWWWDECMHAGITRCNYTNKRIYIIDGIMVRYEQSSFLVFVSQIEKFFETTTFSALIFRSVDLSVNLCMSN